LGVGSRAGCKSKSVMEVSGAKQGVMRDLQMCGARVLNGRDTLQPQVLSLGMYPCLEQCHAAVAAGCRVWLAAADFRCYALAPQMHVVATA
jgi:hypothetical protein